MDAQTITAGKSTENPNTVSLFKNKNFLLAWISNIFTGIASAVYLLSESWYVVKHLNLGASLGLVLMMTAIPRFLLMPFGGVLADRIQKKHIMFFSDATRSLLLVLMIICLAYESLSFTAMLIFALIFGILEAFYWPAASSIIPTIVHETQLAQANSIIQITQQVCSLGGPMIAGIFLTLGSFHMLFAVIAILLFFGAFLVLFLQRSNTVTENTLEESPSFLQEWNEGFSFVKNSSFITALLVTVTLGGFFLTGPLSVTIPLLATSILKGNALTLSFLETSISVGMFLGALVVAGIKLKKKRALIATSSLAFCGIFVLLLGLTNQLILIMLLLGLIGIVVTFSNIFFITLLQEKTPVDKLGRVMSLVTAATTGLLPISYAVITLLLNSGTPFSLLLFIFGGIVTLFCCCLIIFVKVVRTTD
ncbi:MFS transporter [Paenibacillus sp. 102]|uniref:MFS transporter n=1 Tax=Paenibacillus sp. 102 TaxID=3120823 RepID=UPI0031BA8530